MSPLKVATRQEWDAAHAELLAREKQLTRMSDELARERRELPWMPVEKPYTLQTEHGERTLAQLFDGRSQLAVYNFMFGPDYEAGCPVCSSIADSFDPMLPLLAARDVTMISISRAPLEKLLRYRERMGWSFTWASSYESDFNADFGRSHPREEFAEWAATAPPVVSQFAASCSTDAAGYVSERPGLHVFARDGEDVFLTYVANARGLEAVMTYYRILDLVPSGRDGEPPDPGWVRRHDEYAA